MSLPPHTLPILEKWDCHCCTACCRETAILLDAADLKRLSEQRWGEHPDFRGIRTVERSSWLAGQVVLAHQADGSCVFLTPAGRCRIHEQFGVDAKPRMCRQFPLQVVVTDRDAIATVVRSCPSAAADRGRHLDDHVPSLRRLMGNKFADDLTIAPPPIAPRVSHDWKDFHTVAGALERLVVDRRYPLVRRLVHGLRYCTLVGECQWRRIGPEAVAELAAVLEGAAPNDVGGIFQERRPPSPSAQRLFRRLGAHFIRCVPGSRPAHAWLDHWRVFRMSGQLARSRSDAPQLHPSFPSIKVERLERPLGPLSGEVLEPLDRFFESHALSKRFALSPPRHSLIEKFRCLAFTCPMALWMLRWVAAEREATADDMVQIVVALERGFVLPALNSAAGYLAESGELERMIAWYGR
jgi:Fe-S-cluster containining protein